MFRRATICATVLLVAACGAEGQVYDRSASDIADRLLALDLKADRGAGTYHLTADTVAATRLEDGVAWTIDQARGSSYTVRRSVERRVGKGSVGTCRYRWSPDHSKKKKTNKQRKKEQTK